MMGGFYEPKTQRGLFGMIALWTLGLMSLAFLVTAITFGVRWATAGPKGALEAREKIKSGPSRIAAYERFFNLCSQVQADEGTIQALEEEKRTKPSDDRMEQINASITALRSGRNEKIRQYNADSAKGYTIAQFKASRLPYRLDPRQEETQCAA